jgi:hypothetical protein
MTWREATVEALTRMSLRHRRNFFTRTQIISEELHKISQDVSTKGKPPAYTLSRVLQNLRDEGYLEFDGHGGYTLLSSSAERSVSDIPTEYVSPDRTPTTVHRVVRDVGIVAALKRLYGYRCQICTTRLELCSGFYCEAHHLKPLGVPHNGPDAKTNILVVCPNHHVLLDYGASKIHSDSLQLSKHPLDQRFVDYHNRFIYGTAERREGGGSSRIFGSR